MNIILSLMLLAATAFASSPRPWPMGLVCEVQENRYTKTLMNHYVVFEKTHPESSNFAEVSGKVLKPDLSPADGIFGEKTELAGSFDLWSPDKIQFWYNPKDTEKTGLHMGAVLATKTESAYLHKPHFVGHISFAYKAPPGDKDLSFSQDAACLYLPLRLKEIQEAFKK